MRRKHIAQRTCIACRQVFPKRELIRIVRTPEGQVQVDETSKKAGRGAYLCQNPACWEKAIKGKQLGRALKTSLSQKEIDALVQDQLHRFNMMCIKEIKSLES